MNLQELLGWRYAAKRMTGDKLPQDKVDNILASIRLSPSARGFQPYNILVIEDLELRMRIRPVADDQAQIVESSHLLVFAAWSKIDKIAVDRWMTYVAKERGVSVEALLKIRTLLENEQLKMSEEGFQVWAAKQVYLALGIGLIAAAENGVDATPMEGFSPEALDRLLGLDRRGLKSVALMALGYRDVYNDWNLKLKKVRRPAEELFITL